MWHVPSPPCRVSPGSKRASQKLSPWFWLPANHSLLLSAAAACYRDPHLCAFAISRANPFRFMGGQEGWRGQPPMAWRFSDTDRSTPLMGQGLGQESIWSEQPIRALLKRGRLRFLSSGLHMGAHVLRRGRRDGQLRRGKKTWKCLFTFISNPIFLNFSIWGGVFYK